MPDDSRQKLYFKKDSVFANFLLPSSKLTKKEVEIRINPITGRSSRIAFARIDEKETGTDLLPSPPPEALDTQHCPFCAPQVQNRTPQLVDHFDADGRLSYGESILFPNLFPYGSYSAVSLFDNQHFVEIGKASVKSYKNCFINCCHYLQKILKVDPKAHFMAITQNHLPSAGGSLLHPHLQINADKIASNHQRFLKERSNRYFEHHSTFLFSDYLEQEKNDGSRYISYTGKWEWMSAFAPEGFFEIWGVLPGIFSINQLSNQDWEDLSQGIINVQKFYRSLNRNGYNLGILLQEDGKSRLELRLVMLVRSNYGPWVRNDHTGFELILGDMATFSSPEETAIKARPFFEY